MLLNSTFLEQVFKNIGERSAAKNSVQAVAYDDKVCLLTRFSMLVFFTDLSLMEFQVRYLALFLLFAVVDCFGWFWMRSLHNNIQLKLSSRVHSWSYTFLTRH